MTTERRSDRRPYHLGVLLGLSATTYAVSLAGVASLQSTADAAVIADRQPAVETVSALTRRNDELGTRLDEAAANYDATAGSYRPMADGVGALETEIDGLLAAVARIEDRAASLPSRVSLPTRGVARISTTRPATHATTGASGAN